MEAVRRFSLFLGRKERKKKMFWSIVQKRGAWMRDSCHGDDLIC